MTNVGRELPISRAELLCTTNHVILYLTNSNTQKLSLPPALGEFWKGSGLLNEVNKSNNKANKNQSQYLLVPELVEGASEGILSKVMPEGSLCSIVNDGDRDE